MPYPADWGNSQGETDLLEVTFYGVRGSTPCACPDKQRYGGNTSCVVMTGDDGDPIVFDMGTGLRLYGCAYGLDSVFRGTALVTHMHWDHVQGLPFFTPLHVEGSQLEVFGPTEGEGTLADAFATFVNPPFFPIHYSDLAADITFRDVSSDDMQIGPARILSRPVPHVGATVGYRVEWNGRSVAYLPDHQEPVDDPQAVADSVLELVDGVDLLIHDAQFTPAEFQARAHWGHCTIDYALEVGSQGGVGTVALFHHDPYRSDDELDVLLEQAVDRVGSLNVGRVIAASEGMKVGLDG